MANFLDLLVVPNGKATLADFVFVRKHLVEGTVRDIPHCIYDEDGGLNLENLAAHILALARREQPEMELEEVLSRVPATDPEALREILTEIFCFFTSATREELEAAVVQATEDVEGDSVEEAENPTA